MASQPPTTTADTDPPRKFIGAVEDEWVMYSDLAADYTRLSPIGYGASSVVYQAIYHLKDPEASDSAVHDHPCALKVLNLDKLQPSALKLLTRETQLMSLSKHPNVLRVRGSWMMGPHLYIATRLMKKGSVSDIMKYSFIDGLEEDVVKCILYQALQGLNYLHVNGFIHRDIKAANLLVDDDGTVLLGDLGVAVSLTDDEDTGQNKMMSAVRNSSAAAPLVYGAKASAPKTTAPGTAQQQPKTLNKRKSFVGTPSWMAPEVIAQQHYDSSADIWSVGITVIEMCTGRAPGSRERDVKRVLLGTLQNAPPTLDREGGKYKYSKALKELVDSCLNKVPSQRPTVEQLLKHDFFKGVKRKDYLVKKLLADIPPISERQERVLLQKNPQAPKHKAHPLALGSPSLTSIHTDHSWHWNFTATPGSTIHGITPPGSLRGSPSGSVVSLHTGLKDGEKRRRSRSRTGGSISSMDDVRQASVSPTGRRHSRAHSYVPPDLEPEIEVEGEDEVEGEADLNAINAVLGAGLGDGIPLSPTDAIGKHAAEVQVQVDDGLVVDVLATPHVHPALEDVGMDDEDEPEALMLQPPTTASSSVLVVGATNSEVGSSSTATSLSRKSSPSGSSVKVGGTPSTSPEVPSFKLERQMTSVSAVGMEKQSSSASGFSVKSSSIWKKVKSAAQSGTLKGTSNSTTGSPVLRPAGGVTSNIAKLTLGGVGGGSARPSEPERKKSFSATKAALKSWRN